jgi:hypothetical protein
MRSLFDVVSDKSDANKFCFGYSIQSSFQEEEEDDDYGDNNHQLKYLYF